MVKVCYIYGTEWVKLFYIMIGLQVVFIFRSNWGIIKKILTFLLTEWYLMKLLDIVMQNK